MGQSTKSLSLIFKQEKKLAGRQWLSPVFLATQEAEIRRIKVQSLPRQIVRKTLSQKTHHNNMTDGVA
jgi:hypothetical protein